MPPVAAGALEPAALVALLVELAVPPAALAAVVSEVAAAVAVLAAAAGVGDAAGVALEVTEDAAGVVTGEPATAASVRPGRSCRRGT